jgi:signal peptidase I
MFSLCLWSLMLPLTLVLEIWVLARVARAVGSPRHRLRDAFAIALVATLINLGVSLGVGLILPGSWHGSIAAAVVILIGQLFIVYSVIRIGFQLSAGRAVAPFGAYLGVTVVLLVIILGLVRPFVSEAFLIPTVSMSPTVDPGDRILVNKLATPRRWDLIVYVVNDPHGPEKYCKRLVGLPGERLRFENGQVYINDQLQPAPAVVAGRYAASLPNFHSPRYSDGETIQLGDREFFFVGDNVIHSVDSRILGPSDRSALVGVVDVRYWPIGSVAILR